MHRCRGGPILTSDFTLGEILVAITIIEILIGRLLLAVPSARGGRARFLLPGESGQIDYVELLKLLVQAGYDPVAARRTRHRDMTKAFQGAAIRPTSDRPAS